ncbi:predicted protein, partial [Nematostella vectensis]
TDKPLHSVDRRFLSVAIDVHLIRNKWHYFDTSSVRVQTLARGLSPAILRIGGTDGDFAIFQETDENALHGDPLSTNRKPLAFDDLGLEHPSKFRSNFNITPADVDKLRDFAVRAGFDVYFGLNVALRSKDGTWNYTNPIELVKYATRKAYNFSWELGNEPMDLAKFGHPVDAFELGKSFQTLREILDHSRLGGNLVGPDITSISKRKKTDYLSGFLDVAGHAIQAVTWHQYYMNGKNCSIEDFYNPDVLDAMIREASILNDIVSQHAPGKRGWMGETSSAYGGGATNMSDRYVAGFTWLDKLGIAAMLQQDVVIRQTFFGGRYGLLTLDLLPTPDYWLSLLYKRLVGQRVLDVQDAQKEGRMTRVYAHCTNTQNTNYNAGAVTIIALNINTETAVTLRMTGFLQGLDADQFLLTPTNGDLQSSDVELNGEVLKLVDDHTLPSLSPRRVAHDNIVVPPLSFGFFVVPMATAHACTQSHDMTS